MKKRIMSLLLVLLMVLSLVPTVAFATASNDYTQWKQYDSEWNQSEAWPASQYPSATYRWMRQAGCYVTSIAMLLRHYNVVTDSNVKNFNPWICNTELGKVGALDAAADMVAANISKAYPGFAYAGSTTYSASTLVSLYNKGYACVVAVNGYGHYVAVKTANSTDNIVIMDPGSESSSLSRYSSVNGIIYFSVKSAGTHTHDKGQFKFYEADHPHCDCYKCSICGKVWRDTNSSRLLEGCSECYPAKPINGTPTITSEKSAYEPGETVTLKRNTVDNTNYYWIVLYKNDEQILSTEMENDNYTLSNLSTGSYQVYLQVGNATSGTITSKPYNFYVVNRMTTKPVIYADKKSFNYGETVTLKRNTVQNTNYHWLIVYYYDEMILSTGMDESQYLLRDLKPGEYTAYLQVGNLLDKFTSSPFTFNVECTHSWDTGNVITEPTCTTRGEVEYVCTICGEKKISYLEATDHKYIPVITAPTCTAAGYTTYTCSCGDSYKDNYTNALGHSYVSGVCIRCNAKDPNYQAPHTHSYTAAVIAPTCTAKGYTTHTCSCGNSYKDTYVNALGHDYKNGVCTRCKAVNPDYKPPVTVTFVDVPSTEYYYEAVNWAVGKGITTGVGNNRFDPNGQCTRGQVVTFLWRAAGKPTVNATVSFTDVKPSEYYYEAVKWAVANGITDGVGGNRFAPNDTCTRGQVVTFLHRAANSPSARTVSSFTDVSTTAFYYNAVNWAVEKGITNGTGGGCFSPNDTCTRGQVVTFLYRASK